MATVGGVGIGFIILAVVWVLCLFACVTLTRAQGAIAYAGTAAVLVAIVLTLVLWFFPRGADPDAKDYIIYDSYYIPRTSLVTVLGFMLAVGGMFVVMLHIFEPQKATPLKKIRA